MSHNVTIGSLFSGIGGLERGLERAGLGPVVWQCEIDPFCRRVLEKHWPGVERFDDVRAVNATNARPVEVICGGFPCQDVSAAGKGAGLAGERSGLWREFARIVDELRPRWVVVENVASGASRWFDAVVRDLEERGYDVLPVPLSALDVGAPHIRKRLFLVAHARSRYALGNEQRQACSNAQSVRHGTARPVADPISERRPSLSTQVGHGSTDDQWSTEPDVGRVAHGVPSRLDRLRALGNSVVPQCAEVVGWVIRELEAS